MPDRHELGNEFLEAKFSPRTSKKPEPVHKHTRGGNDYISCDDCGQEWNYRKPGSEPPTCTPRATNKRGITEEELESLQHEAFVLGQTTGLLLKYGYKPLATQLYNAAQKIMDQAAKVAYEKEFGDGKE